MGNVGSIQTAKGEIFTNAHVLSQSRAGLGYFVFSGCDVNQSGTPGMSVVVDSGYIQSGWGTTQKTVTGGTVVITAAHPTLPRIDTIYIDSNGTSRVYDGTATAISPGDKIDFKQMATPAPGTNIPSGVIIALVYVAAGDTAITNAEILDIATYGPLLVEAPTTTTSGKIPYWSSTAKTLSDGYTVGTTSNCLLQLDSSARIPAVSGSLLTSISHGNLTNLSVDDHTQYIKHALATSSNDFLVSSGSGTFIKKTLAETKTVLGLGSAAYTASTDYAVAANGVTNGNTHDHLSDRGASLASQFVGIGANISLGSRLDGYIYTYDNGIADRCGIGIRNGEMQNFIPNIAHYSWNIGGDLQVSGTNELMRLTGAGDLGLGCIPAAKLHVRGTGLGIYGGLLIDNIEAEGEWGIATGQDNKLYLMAPGGAQIVFDPVTGDVTGLPIVNSHIASSSNPHNTTYGQVGAAPAAQGVTNGDSHDHSGGDGAQIAYSSLSGKPTRRFTVPFTVGDGYSVLPTDSVFHSTEIEIPVACTIIAARIHERTDTTGNILCQLYRRTYSGSWELLDEYQISSGNKYEETGLSISVNAGDWLTVAVVSVATMTQITCSLTCEAV